MKVIERMKQSLATFIVEKPKTSILFALIFALLLSLGLINLKMQFGYRVWFHKENPLIIQLDQFEKDFGTSDMAILSLRSDHSIYAKDNLSYIQKITEKLWQDEDALRVESITNTTLFRAVGDDIIIEDLFPSTLSLTDKNISLKKDLTRDEQSIKSRLISPDEKTSLIFISIRAIQGKSPKYSKILQGFIDGIRNIQKPNGLSIEVAGNPAVTSTFRKSAEKDASLLLPLFFFVISLVIWIKFRSLKVLAITYSTLTVTIASMLGIAGHLHIPFHNLLSVTPEFIIAIGIADLIHILSTYYIFQHGQDNRSALIHSIEKNFIPTIMTSLTTAIGFLSFVSEDIKNLADMGLITAVGTILAWLFTYFLSIPLITLLKLKAKEGKKNRLFSFDFTTYVLGLIRHRKKVYLANFLFLILTLSTIPLLSVNSDPLDYFSPRIKLKSIFTHIEQSIGGVFSLEMQVNAEKGKTIKDPELLQRIEAFSKKIEQENPTITKVTSLVDILKKINQLMNENKKEFYTLPHSPQKITDYLFFYSMSVPEGKSLNDRMTIDEKSLRISAMMKNMDSKSSVKLFEKIYQTAKRYHLNISLTGKRLLWQSINEKVVYTFITSLLTALLLISILLMLFFRSFRVGILSLFPNVIPITSISLIMVMMGRHFDIGTSLVAAIVLGIAVDDTIHIASTYMEYQKENFNREQILIKLFNNTAPALISTTVVLSVSFLMFIFATFIPNQNLGILMATNLFIALICDLTLFPILLYDFARRSN